MEATRSDLQKRWQAATDEELAAAAENLDQYPEEAIEVIRAEVRRRGVPHRDTAAFLRGVAKTSLAPEGTVFLRGEYWTARADDEIPVDARVEAVAVDGMRLQVKRADD